MKYSKQFVEQVEQSKFVQNLRRGVIQMDNSEFTQWDGCHAQGVYYGTLKRVNARNRTALAFGDALHVGLEAFFKGDKDFVKLALARAATLDLDEMGDPRRNSGVLETLLLTYTLDYNRHLDSQFNILRINDVPQIETSFSVPLGSINLASTRNFGSGIHIDVGWDGKMDLLTDYEREIWPVDHKSTTVMGEKFTDDKVRSSQMLGYTYAARYLAGKLFPGRSVGGCRINALALRSGGFDFKIFDIPYADWKVAEWQRETLIALEDLVLRLDRFLSTGEIAPTRQHCVTKYGKCPYFDVCDTTELMRDRLLFNDDFFYVSTWSPLGE